MKAYYRKFSYIWISILALLAMYFIAGIPEGKVSSGIAVIPRLPKSIRIILLALLAIVVIIQISTRKNTGENRKRIRIVSAMILVPVFIDGFILRFVDRIIYVSGLSETPEKMLDTMIYMTVNSRKIWLNGLVGTLEVSLLGTIIGFLLAILLVFIRVNPPQKRDRQFAQFLKTIGVTIEQVYVSIIRGTPMMVQGCVIYYAGFMVTRSMMASAPISSVNKVWTFFMAALITVSLNTSAYLSEVLRGGVEALDKGQREACEALGFTKWQSLTKVIFPQAVKNVLPSIANEFINNIKGTSVLNVFGFVELMFATSSVAGFYYKYLASYLIAAILYYILTFTMTALMNAMMKKTGFMK